MKRSARFTALVAVGCVCLVWVVWAISLLSPDSYLARLLKADSGNRFLTLGPFGDAFGPIASLMATIAAAGALYTFANDRYDKKLQNFESNFFSMLTTLESITRQAEITFGRRDPNIKYSSKYAKLEKISTRNVIHEFNGRIVFTIIVYRIREKVGLDGYKNIKIVSSAYDSLFNGSVNTLGHYFRTIHHICRLIRERCPGDQQYYARILRAQLSNSELCLLAYNCIVGEGRLKFKTMAVDYSLFHNLHRQDRDDYAIAELDFFRRKLPPEAFRLEHNPPITYDD